MADNCLKSIQNLNILTSRQSISATKRHTNAIVPTVKNYPLAQSCDTTIAYALPNNAGQNYQSICIFDPNKKKSNSFSTNQKTLTSISFSVDGRYLASAESGHKSKVQIFDSSTRTLVCSQELQGSIDHVNFTLAQYQLVVVTSVELSVWQLQIHNKIFKLNKLAVNKISATKIKKIALSKNGAYFVTIGEVNMPVGKTTLQFLYTLQATSLYTLKVKTPYLLDKPNTDYCDVVCGLTENTHETVFCVTHSGWLTQIDQSNVKQSINVFNSGTNEHAYSLPICTSIHADMNGNLFLPSSNGSVILIEQDNLTKLKVIRRPDLTFDFTHLTVNKSDGSLFYWSLNESDIYFKKIASSQYNQNDTDNPDENDEDIENLSDCIRQQLIVKNSNTTQDRPRPSRARWTINLNYLNELEFMVDESELMASRHDQNATEEQSDQSFKPVQSEPTILPSQDKLTEDHNTGPANEVQLTNQIVQLTKFGPANKSNESSIEAKSDTTRKKKSKEPKAEATKKKKSNEIHNNDPSNESSNLSKNELAVRKNLNEDSNDGAKPSVRRSTRIIEKATNKKS